MSGSRARSIALGFLFAALAAATVTRPATAGTITRTYSSGRVDASIPSPGSVEVPIRVRGGGPVAALRFRLRISHRYDSDLRIGVVDPRGHAYLLAYHVGRSGHDFGSGPRNCRGNFTTVIDSPDEERTLSANSPPFLGSFSPYVEGLDLGYRLSELHGRSAAGVWRLRVTDTRRAHAGGVIHCWQLAVTRATPVVVRSRVRRIRAKLSWLEIDGRFLRLRLKISRGGTPLRHDPLRLKGQVPEEQVWPMPLDYPADKLRLLSIRDLDGDGEPEVVINARTGGNACCQVSEIYRFVGATKSYALAFREWGKGAEATLADENGDGIPEFATRDNRFCFSCSYPVLAYPIKLLQFRRGRFWNVTRRLPHVVARDASRLWHGYRQLGQKRLRREYSPRIFRSVLIDAYAAEESLLGRAGLAWAHAQEAAHRGDLGSHPASYLRRLRRYLKAMGYLG